ncbi:hypothetical protein CLU79DRAFT_766262 [Phycomyces nitens]|nr:hypothetical protein CLU79DRAFT_766262 [Phycomyces nitens]
MIYYSPFTFELQPNQYIPSHIGTADSINPVNFIYSPPSLQDNFPEYQDFAQPYASFDSYLQNELILLNNLEYDYKPSSPESLCSLMTSETCPQEYTLTQPPENFFTELEEPHQLKEHYNLLSYPIYQETFLFPAEPNWVSDSLGPIVSNTVSTPPSAHKDTPNQNKSHKSSKHRKIKKSKSKKSLKSLTSPKMFYCEHCDYKSYRLNNKSRHALKHTDEVREKSPCDLCAKSYSSRSNMLRHKKLHHPSCADDEDQDKDKDQ